jgi:hypothetical protein
VQELRSQTSARSLSWTIWYPYTRLLTAGEKNIFSTKKRRQKHTIAVKLLCGSKFCKRFYPAFLFKIILHFDGFFTTVADPDPDSIGSVDPDPESGSGSRRAKMTHKSRKKFVKVHVLKCWMASFES